MARQFWVVLAVVIVGWTVVYYNLRKDAPHFYQSERQNNRILDKLFKERIKKENLSMDHPDVISSIRRAMTYPKPEIPQNLTEIRPSGDYAQFGQGGWVDSHLKHRNNGFFVECGAFDGQMFSNTLFFELKRNWTGLLVEVGRNVYRQILDRKRHVYSINACLSPIKSPSLLKFTEVHAIGGLDDFQEPSHAYEVKRRGHKPTDNTVTAICYPFYSLMLAIGRTRIDFFSLDVEGAELFILNTIPLDKIYIEFFLVEYAVWGSGHATDMKIMYLRQFFNETKLYKEVAAIGGQDIAFRRIDSG